MTDLEVVQRKLALLRDHAARLARRRPADLERLRADDDLQDAIALSLFVAIQETIDVAFHVATDERWGTPASNAEAFELLRRNAVIELGLSDAMGRMATLRNRIAHGYSTVDVERLWRELPQGLATLDAFATAVERWLDSRPTS